MGKRKINKELLESCSFCKKPMYKCTCFSIHPISNGFLYKIPKAGNPDNITDGLQNININSEIYDSILSDNNE